MSYCQCIIFNYKLERLRYRKWNRSESFFDKYSRSQSILHNLNTNLLRLQFTGLKKKYNGNLTTWEDQSAICARLLCKKSRLLHRRAGAHIVGSSFYVWFKTRFESDKLNERIQQILTLMYSYPFYQLNNKHAHKPKV